MRNLKPKKEAAKHLAAQESGAAGACMSFVTHRVALDLGALPAGTIFAPGRATLTSRASSFMRQALAGGAIVNAQKTGFEFRLGELTPLPFAWSGLETSDGSSAAIFFSDGSAAVCSNIRQVSGAHIVDIRPQVLSLRRSWLDREGGRMQQRIQLGEHWGGVMDLTRKSRDEATPEDVRARWQSQFDAEIAAYERYGDLHPMVLGEGESANPIAVPTEGRVSLGFWGVESDVLRRNPRDLDRHLGHVALSEALEQRARNLLRLAAADVLAARRVIGLSGSFVLLGRDGLSGVPGQVIFLPIEWDAATASNLHSVDPAELCTDIHELLSGFVKDLPDIGFVHADEKHYSVPALASISTEKIKDSSAHDRLTFRRQIAALLRKV